MKKLLFAIVFLLFLSCEDKENQGDKLPAYKSFRDIPGVTSEEIAAILALQKEHSTFSYGMTLTTEAFINENSEVGGYAALFCKWISGIFGIQFKPEVYAWNDLLEKLNDGTLDFAGNLIESEERKKIYHMSDPIAERQYKMMRIKGSPALNKIAQERQIKFAFLKGAVHSQNVESTTAPNTYEPVWVNDYSEVYEILKGKAADAFIAEDAMEASFAAYDDIYIEDFLPLIFSPVSMATSKAELKPVISVLTKALQSGAMPYLNSLFNQGYEEYKRHKFYLHLNDDEKEFLKNTSYVPLLVQYFNYPVCFFDTHNKKWDGIAMNLLREVEKITGLSFEVVNDEHAEMPELIAMLSSGKGHIFADLILTKEREPSFIWNRNKFMADQYALLSGIDYPNVNINEIPYKRIGLVGSTAHKEMFHTWFPEATNTIEYVNLDEAFQAISRGEVDLLMAAKTKLLYYLNYHESPDYKANFLFNYYYESAFAFNKEQRILSSIVDKAISIINTDVVVEQWVTKTYDYRKQLAEARLPWLLGMTAMALISIALILILFYRTKAMEADKHALLMIEQAPFIALLWDDKFNIIDCNQEAVRMFGFNNKKEVKDKFLKLLPEHQPNGMTSQELLQKGHSLVFIEKRKLAKIELTVNHSVTGEAVPFDVTLVRIKYKNEYAVLTYGHDLRERYAAIEKIHEAEEHSMLMLENVPLVVMLWSERLEILDCNQEAVRVFGFRSKKEYIDRFFEFVPEYQPNGMKTQDLLLKAHSTIFHEKEFAKIEWTMNHSVTGEVIPFDITLVRIKYKDGYAALSYALDLRERNNAIAKLREADEKTRLMFDAMPLCSNFWTSDGTIYDCNDEVVRLFDLKNKQEYIDRFADLSPEYQPDGRPSAETAAALVAKTFEEGYCRFEWMMQKLNGEPVPTEVFLIRLKHQNDYIVVAYFRDLRELKASIEKLRESDESAQIMLEQTPLVVMLWDKDANILNCNQEAIRVTGLSSKEEYIERLFELTPNLPDGTKSSEAAKKAISYCLETGSTRIPWALHHAVTGELIPFDVTVVKVKYKGEDVVISYAQDVRERNAAIEKIREADDKARVMIEQAPLVVMLWDQDANIIDCNQEAINILGLSSKQEYIDRFFEIAPDQLNGIPSKEAAKMLLNKTLETGFERVEWILNHPETGEAIPFESTIARIKYKDGYIIMSYGQDVRDRNAAMAKMREADERAQIMFDIAPFAGCMFDKDMNMIDCNKEAVKMFGIPDKEFFLTRHRELFPEHQPDGRTSAEVSAENVRMALENGYHNFECLHRKFSGDPLPIKSTLMSVKHKGKDVLASYFTDLTEQKLKEMLAKEVMEKTSTLTAIFDSTTDMIFCKDVDLNYTECNKAMENFFNIHRSDIIGKVEAEALNMPPEISKHLLDADRKIIAEKRVNISEELVKSHDGKMVHFEIMRSPLIQDGEVVGLVGMARDITQRKEMAQLAKQRFESEVANKAKSSFLASMSHEMRTPMNAILGVTEIQLQSGNLHPDTKNALNIIYNSGYTLLGIINDLLDLSKIEAGKLELINERYETASLINDTVNLNTVRIGSKPIEFKLYVDEDLPFELIGDELRVKQILNNLLSNAFKYTDKGEVDLSFSAQIEEQKVTLTIIVSDTGQGMDEEQIRALFDAYSRFNMKANRFVEGTGLGMNIVQHLVNKMDGDISVESEPGKGTEVLVHLTQGYAGPAKLGYELAESIMGFQLTGMSNLKKAQIVREHMPYGNVLVVDDMETNLYVAKGFLLPYGLTIDTALSGMAAIEKIENGNVYDIIFMDHMMPVMDGIEAVRIIRSKGYDCPIVALTANAVAGQADVFMANGFDGFISKPIDIRELNASLNKHVRDRQPIEVVEAARAAYGAEIIAEGEAMQVDPELAKIFIHDAQKAMAVLESYNSEDLQMYIINVHALKSALANIGETKLSSFARELEQAGRDKKRAFLSNETPIFLNELREIMDRLKSANVEYGSGEVSGEDMEHLREMLRAIKDACANYNANAAMSVLKELKQKQWPSPYGELLDTITMHLLHSDFDEAGEVCKL